MTTLARACLECGERIESGMRCEQCGKTNHRGYDAAWKHLVAAAIAAQPWCTDCNTEGDDGNPLSGDHLRWPATSLGDIEVVCRRCNSARGPRRGTYRKADEKNLEDGTSATRPVRPPITHRRDRSTGVVIA
jgi:hypothetical protein